MAAPVVDVIQFRNIDDATFNVAYDAELAEIEKQCQRYWFVTVAVPRTPHRRESFAPPMAPSFRRSNLTGWCTQSSPTYRDSKNRQRFA